MSGQRDAGEKSRERKRRRRALREHTHYLNARHSVRSMQPPRLYAPSYRVPSLSLSRSLLFFFSVFCSPSVAYSECCPTIVKWTIFDSSVLGLGEAAATARSFQGKTFLNKRDEAFHAKDATYRMVPSEP